MNIQKLFLATGILTIVATGLLAFSPSINAQAQMYNDRNEYSANYNNAYSPDDKNSKKSSDVNIQKLKCVNSNLNLNGIDITQIPSESNALAAANEGGGVTEGATNTQQNGNGLSDSLNVERNLVNICANVNANDQLKVEEQTTLTVNKEVFGCTNILRDAMRCDELQNDSPLWLPCIGSSISGNEFCQNLPLNFFDIEVLNDQDTQIQQFEGSTAGTTIQNLQPGTYAVNEIKHASNENQLGPDATTEQECTSLGFVDGGYLRIPSTANHYFICFEYEDEQGNDCSTVTLAEGEHKTCTVKNYIHIATEIL